MINDEAIINPSFLTFNWLVFENDDDDDDDDDDGDYNMASKNCVLSY